MTSQQQALKTQQRASQTFLFVLFRVKLVLNRVIKFGHVRGKEKVL